MARLIYPAIASADGYVEDAWRHSMAGGATVAVRGPLTSDELPIQAGGQADARWATSSGGGRPGKDH
jgi:hypothetical protein